MSLGNNNCVLAFDSTKGVLFTDLKPGDKKVVQLHVNSVSIVEPVEEAAIKETGLNRSDTKTRKTVWESVSRLRLKPKA